MASAQVAGLLKIYHQRPDGSRKLAHSGNIYYFGPGGSSDGAVGNTPEKWNFLSPSGVKSGSGYSVVVTFTAGAAATLDISDAAWILPVIVNGNKQTLGNPSHASGLGNDNFVNDFTIGDSALVASVETVISVLRAKEGVNFQTGGDRVFMSIENNA